MNNVWVNFLSPPGANIPRLRGVSEYFYVLGVHELASKHDNVRRDTATSGGWAHGVARKCRETAIIASISCVSKVICNDRSTPVALTLHKINKSFIVCDFIRQSAKLRSLNYDPVTTVH